MKTKSVNICYFSAVSIESFKAVLHKVWRKIFISKNNYEKVIGICNQSLNITLVCLEQWGKKIFFTSIIMIFNMYGENAQCPNKIKISVKDSLFGRVIKTEFKIYENSKEEIRKAKTIKREKKNNRTFY